MVATLSIPLCCPMPLEPPQSDIIILYPRSSVLPDLFSVCLLWILHYKIALLYLRAREDE